MATKPVCLSTVQPIDEPIALDVETSFDVLLRHGVTPQQARDIFARLESRNRDFANRIESATAARDFGAIGAIVAEQAQPVRFNKLGNEAVQEIASLCKLQPVPVVNVTPSHKGIGGGARIQVMPRNLLGIIARDVKGEELFRRVAGSPFDSDSVKANCRKVAKLQLSANGKEFYLSRSQFASLPSVNRKSWEANKGKTLVGIIAMALAIDAMGIDLDSHLGALEGQIAQTICFAFTGQRSVPKDNKGLMD